MNQKRYKITNTTVRPVKTNSRGQDTRTVRERVGNLVGFVINGTHIMLRPGKSTIISNVDEGILGLYRAKKVRIDVIEDIADELKLFAERPPQTEAVAPKKEEPRAEAPKEVKKEESVLFTKEESPFEPKREKEAPTGKAVPMGETSHDGDKLVNPDGEPNFVAKAPKGGPKRKKKASESDGE